MLTVRDATKLLSAYLGVEVAPHAARLVRDSILPRRGKPIDEEDAASLLLAVAATADPDQAVDALSTITCAPLASIERAIPGTALGVQAWRLTTIEDSDRVPIGAAKAVAEALQGTVAINWMVIDDGGSTAMFELIAGGPYGRR